MPFFQQKLREKTSITQADVAEYVDGLIAKAGTGSVRSEKVGNTTFYYDERDKVFVSIHDPNTLKPGANAGSCYRGNQDTFDGAIAERELREKNREAQPEDFPKDEFNFFLD